MNNLCSNSILRSLAIIGLLLTACEKEELEPLTQQESPDVEEQTPTTDYEIGDIGPGGGYVFYDKGNNDDGWRYMEASPEDLGSFEWGCFSTSIEGAKSLDVGGGRSNTEAIVNFHDSLDDYYLNPTVCSDDSDGTVAAKTALDLISGNMLDWYLPSQQESYLMYQNLHLNGFGNFNESTLYWTSTEHDEFTATATDFSNGDQGWLCKPCNEVTNVRALRYF